MKNKNVKSIIYICCIVFISLGFYSCVDIPQDYKHSTFLELDGNIDNINSIIDISDISIYNQATKRVYKELYIKNDKLAWDVYSGSQLNMSEELFELVIEGFSKTNIQIEKGEMYLWLDENNQIRFSSTKSISDKVIRLKSGNIEDYPLTSDGKIDCSNMTMQELLDAVYDFYDTQPADNTSDWFDFDTIDWETDNGSTYITGTGEIDGQPASFVLFDACSFNNSDEGEDCWANDWGQNMSTSYSDRDQYTVKNPAHGSIININVYK